MLYFALFFKRGKGYGEHSKEKKKEMILDIKQYLKGMIEIAGIIQFEIKWLTKGKIRHLSSLGYELNQMTY